MAEKIEAKDIIILSPEKEKQIELAISTVVVEVNATDEVIAKMKSEFMELKINGNSDKEGYLIVKETRKQVKKFRVVIEKALKRGREEANLEAKKWLIKRDELVPQIEEIEDYLEKQEKEYEAADALKKKQEADRIEQQAIFRTTDMVKFGAQLIDGKWVLENVSYEVTLVKSVDDDVYQDIKAEFQSRFDVKENARIEQERLQQEQQNSIKRQQEEIQRQQEELQRQQDILKKQQEAQAENERRAKANERKALAVKRKSDLESLEVFYIPSTQCFEGWSISMSLERFEKALDGELDWEEMMREVSAVVEDRKEKARLKKEEDDRKEEEKRLKDIEDVKIKGIGASRRQSLLSVKCMYPGSDQELGALEQDKFDSVYAGAKDTFDKEAKRQSDLKRQEELDLMGDKEKYAIVIEYLNDTPNLEFRSGQYRGKIRIIRDFLDGLK